MYLSLFHQKQPIHLHDVKYALKLESEQLSKKDAVTRDTPNKGGWGKKTKQSVADDAQAEDQQSEPTNNTSQAGEQQALAKRGTVQPSTSDTQPNDPIAQMLLMMQQTFNEQLKF